MGPNVLSLDFFKFEFSSSFYNDDSRSCTLKAYNHHLLSLQHLFDHLVMNHSQFDRIIWIYITYILILSLPIFMVLSHHFESNTIFILGLCSNWLLGMLQNHKQSHKMYLQEGNNIFFICKYTKTIINSIYCLNSESKIIF